MIKRYKSRDSAQELARKRAAYLERAAQIGRRIKEARIKQGLSQHGLALQLGVTAGAVGQWEIGANLPQMATFDKLVQVLDVSRDWLMTGLNPQERGIAQDVNESQMLALSREMSAEGRLAALTVMEEFRNLATDDTLGLTEVISRWAQLSPEFRRSVLAMMSSLSPNETETKPKSKPIVSPPVKRLGGGRGKNASSPRETMSI